MRSLIPPLLALLTLASGARADEGMWLYNHPPREQVRARYGFELTDAWLDHLMKSSVRFNSGGSGSFVSEDGLVLSNHHVGADALQKLSTDGKNYLRDGFQAGSLAEEVRCVDLELNVLQQIVEVTARVNAAVPAGAAPEEAFKARRRVMAEIEKESLDQTGLRSDVVTLYQGGQYHLYRFKKYTDVRLVFAPEQQIAFFGGDPDNFEYPRYDLDVCFFRVYENGRPARVPHHLKWSAAGAQPGELTFVSGHPGRTSRLLTVAELEYQRDRAVPYLLSYLKRREVLLNSWSQRSAENARRAKDDLFGIQNSRKARDGGHAGLYDPALMGAKQAAEKALRARLAGRPEFADAAAAHERIAAAQEAIGRVAVRYRLLEGAHGVSCDSFGIARTLLRAGDERPKPSGERLREFAEAGRESLEMELFSDKPIHEDLERLYLGDSLTWLAEMLGWNDPLVQAVLAGQSPRARAAQLIQGTQVRQVAFRRKLYEGGASAVRAAADPMVELARVVDAEARELRRTMESQEEVKKQAHAALARAWYALDGASGYPDATFTLRLSYGTVKGYREAGREVPPFTVYQGLGERAASMGHRPPFDLPDRWMKRLRRVDPRVPLNFVGTHDIIGGNSGSPVVNRAGEFVGIIFDGNLQSLVLDYAFEEEQARSLSVHSSGILEALRQVYQARPLVEELRAGRRRS
ncbi:MAG: S46 family peptidase [Verrucomicrobiota bacterium]